jgi:hypothetical protein
MRSRTPYATDSMSLVVHLWFGFAALTVALTACVDESHQNQIDALGGEAPGVPKGPLHRPGQPCTVCHGEGGPASTMFVLAGTVFQDQGKTDPANGAQIQIEDVNGSFYTATTNEVGNFYITPDQWMPVWPLHVQGVTLGKNFPQAMLTLIGRAGSCGECHTPTTGPTSPGLVYAIPTPISTGGH